MNTCLFSEGIKQTRPDSTYNPVPLYLTKGLSYTEPFGIFSADSNHSIHIKIKNLYEKICFGLNYELALPIPLYCRISHNGSVVYGPITIPINSGQPGYIDNYSQAIKGPNLINPLGYIPLVYTPFETGDYVIEFDFLNAFKNVELYDFTVVDTSIMPNQAKKWKGVVKGLDIPHRNNNLTYPWVQSDTIRKLK